MKLVSSQYMYLNAAVHTPVRELEFSSVHRMCCEQALDRLNDCVSNHTARVAEGQGRMRALVCMSSRVWRFAVGAELAVQSQQRRTSVHDTHSCSQHCLVLEQVGLELALE